MFLSQKHEVFLAITHMDVCCDEKLQNFIFAKDLAMNGDCP